MYPQHIPIYTDGSQQNNHTAAAVVFKNKIISKRLPNLATVYTAELYAILLALTEISKQQDKYHIIFSDSLSSLQSIANKKLEHPITLQILLKYHKLSINFYNVIFCWLPSHIGISGNEQADKAAKAALTQPISPIPLPHTDFKLSINKYIHSKWQQSWNLQTQNKLYQIYPIIPAQSTLPPSYHRKDQILYNRLHIGHNRLTHSCLIEHTEPPKCSTCQEILSVNHILTECISYLHERQQYCPYTNIKDFFTLSDCTNIIKYIKNIKLCDKL